jgi:hypothetical protein
VPITRFATTAPPVDAVAQVDAVAASFWRVAVQVFASLAAGGASYLLVLRLLGAPELASFGEILRRRRGASQPAPVE